MKAAGSTTWQGEAACATSSAAGLFTADHPDLFDVRTAVTVCKACPVRVECLEFAMDAEGGYDERARNGIWGGMTPRQRFTLHLARKDLRGLGAAL